MIYPYDSATFTPPAPVLPILISSPLSEFSPRSCQALIDSGADITIIPEETIQALSLWEIDRQPVGGVTCEPVEKLVYLARIEVQGMYFVCPIMGWPQPYALLGRDILNQWLVHLDGPSQRFEIP